MTHHMQDIDSLAAAIGADLAMYCLMKCLQSKLNINRGQSEVPLFSFGVVTDIQFAVRCCCLLFFKYSRSQDVPDGWNYSKTKERFYRDALIKYQHCVNVCISIVFASRLKKVVTVSQTWNAASPKLAFALQLGDLFDGLNKRSRWIVLFLS